MDPLQKFIKQKIRDTFDYTHEHGQPIIMYRGESKKWENPLTSTLSRDFKKYPYDFDTELKYYKQCYSKLYNYEEPFESAINLSFLSFLRHNNFPTRLIDVTPSIETALFFVVNDKPKEEGFIYRITGFDISNNLSNYETADLRSVITNRDFKYLANQYVFFKDTNIYNVRARRQIGWHVVQKGVYENLVDVISISSKEKAELKEHLYSINYNNVVNPEMNQILEEQIEFLNYFNRKTS